MLNPIHMFDSAPITTGFELGAKLGAVNSPLTPLGQALDKTLQKYDAHLAAQGAQANAMALQKSKNENDLAVAKIGAGYAPDGSAPLPEIEPEIVWAEGPNGEPMYATKKSKGGRIVQSDFTYAPRPVSASQRLDDMRAEERIKRRKEAAAQQERIKRRKEAAAQQERIKRRKEAAAQKPNVIQQGATPQAPAVQRIKVRDAKGNIGTIPASQLNDAMKQGYQRI